MNKKHALFMFGCGMLFLSACVCDNMDEMAEEELRYRAASDRIFLPKYHKMVSDGPLVFEIHIGLSGKTNPEKTDISIRFAWRDRDKNPAIPEIEIAGVKLTNVIKTEKDFWGDMTGYIHNAIGSLICTHDDIRTKLVAPIMKDKRITLKINGEECGFIPRKYTIYEYPYPIIRGTFVMDYIPHPDSSYEYQKQIPQDELEYHE